MVPFGRATRKHGIHGMVSQPKAIR